jgi:hypothetical protein
MKNYKQALFNAISDSTNTARENLNGYSQDFITDSDADSSQYICDAIMGFADSRTSIYYSSIMEFIKDNPDAVNDAINEFGWDGCGRDIYKAGQMAEYMSIEQEIYNELNDIIKYITLDFIDSTDEADDDADKIWQTLTEKQKGELLTTFIDDLEMIDNNSRLDEVSDLYNDFITAILDAEESDEESNG